MSSWRESCIPQANSFVCKRGKKKKKQQTAEVVPTFYEKTGKRQWCVHVVSVKDRLAILEGVLHLPRKCSSKEKMGRESQYLSNSAHFKMKGYIKMGSEDAGWHTEENCSCQLVSGCWPLEKLK